MRRSDQPGSTEQRAELARLKRAARKHTREDWATLFRQMQDAITQIAQHKFLNNDQEAQARIKQMLLSADLEEMDRAFDYLEEYVEGKVAAEMIRRGEAPPAPKVKHNAVNTRAMSQMGPSGDDFCAQSTPEVKKQRSVIRL